MNKLDNFPPEPGLIINHNIPPGVWEEFEIKPSFIPPTARRIVDEQMGGCIGYADEGARGVWHIYNAVGQKVAIEEIPLEASPIDPFDVLIIGGLLLKVGRWGWIARKNGTKAMATTGTAVVQKFAKLLRAKLLAPKARQLKFTRTAAQHMAEPGRFVPIYILEGAIRLGARTADPQRIKGLYMYRAEMIKLRKTNVVINGRVEVRYFSQKYKLEVLVREADWTISHFLYK
ncbi:hypothetical protein [Acidovorax sp. NCPPB 4044]|uniref:hypothetical protein n=1 Tax=Acidovorax sp. NCPPB 4044 TaxID=2940490 RepID=UPI002304CCF4|nr:hypothetical protein [Acidovorax sp. NCPPB 4044]MDA8521048.1 hypothetical protein [Acidovorax sp. NCPPB 4044]